MLNSIYSQKRKYLLPARGNVFDICMIQIEYNTLTSSQLKNKVFFAAGLLAILVFSAVIDPDQNDFLPCFFKEITGYSCPSCGLSHSFYAVSHLHFMAAFQFHFMGPAIYFIFLLLFIKYSIEVFIKKEFRFKFNPFVVKSFIVIFVGLWLVYWILRFFNEVRS